MATLFYRHDTAIGRLLNSPSYQFRKIMLQSSPLGFVSSLCYDAKYEFSRVEQASNIIRKGLLTLTMITITHMRDLSLGFQGGWSCLIIYSIAQRLHMGDFHAISSTGGICRASSSLASAKNQDRRFYPRPSLIFFPLASCVTFSTVVY